MPITVRPLPYGNGVGVVVLRSQGKSIEDTDLLVPELIVPHFSALETEMVSKYRVDQKRDYHGRFADEGGGSGGGGSSGSGVKEEKPQYGELSASSELLKLERDYAKAAELHGRKPSAESEARRNQTLFELGAYHQRKGFTTEQQKASVKRAEERLLEKFDVPPVERDRAQTDEKDEKQTDVPELVKPVSQSAPQVKATPVEPAQDAPDAGTEDDFDIIAKPDAFKRMTKEIFFSDLETSDLSSRFDTEAMFFENYLNDFKTQTRQGDKADPRTVGSLLIVSEKLIDIGQRAVAHPELAGMTPENAKLLLDRATAARTAVHALVKEKQGEIPSFTVTDGRQTVHFPMKNGKWVEEAVDNPAPIDHPNGARSSIHVSDFTGETTVHTSLGIGDRRKTDIFDRFAPGEFDRETFVPGSSPYDPSKNDPKEAEKQRAYRMASYDDPEEAKIAEAALDKKEREAKEAGGWRRFGIGTSSDDKELDFAFKPTKSGHRALSAIAADISDNWRDGIGTFARRYLKALSDLTDVSDGSAAQTITDFLANARSWTGADAKRIKAELLSILKRQKVKKSFDEDRWSAMSNVTVKGVPQNESGVVLSSRYDEAPALIEPPSLDEVSKYRPDQARGFHGHWVSESGGGDRGGPGVSESKPDYLTDIGTDPTLLKWEKNYAKAKLEDDRKHTSDTKGARIAAEKLLSAYHNANAFTLDQQKASIARAEESLIGSSHLATEEEMQRMTDDAAAKRKKEDALSRQGMGLADPKNPASYLPGGAFADQITDKVDPVGAANLAAGLARRFPDDAKAVSDPKNPASYLPGGAFADQITDKVDPVGAANLAAGLAKRFPDGVAEGKPDYNSSKPRSVSDPMLYGSTPSREAKWLTTLISDNDSDMRAAIEKNSPADIAAYEKAVAVINDPTGDVGDYAGGGNQHTQAIESLGKLLVKASNLSGADSRLRDLADEVRSASKNIAAADEILGKRNETNRAGSIAASDATRAFAKNPRNSEAVAPGGGSTSAKPVPQSASQVKAAPKEPYGQNVGGKFVPGIDPSGQNVGGKFVPAEPPYKPTFEKRSPAEQAHIDSFDQSPKEKPMSRSVFTPTESGHRPLDAIARDIRRNWKGEVNYAAKPYLDALGSLNDVRDNYGADPAEQIIAYFLSNARSWKGDEAKRIKAELLAILNPKKTKKSGGWIGPLKAVSKYETGEADGEGEIPALIPPPSTMSWRGRVLLSNGPR